MDAGISFRRGRGRGGHETNGRGRPHSKNKTWVAGSLRNGTSASNHVENERWERGGNRGGRNKRGSRNQNLAIFNASRESQTPAPADAMDGEEEEHHEEEYEDEVEEDELIEETEEPILETPEAREKFYQEVRL